MFQLKTPFAKADTQGVTLPIESLAKSLLQYADHFSEDSRFTNDVFLTLGLSRFLKTGAKTIGLFTRPEETIRLKRGKYEQPLELPGSEAAFITYYKTWGGKLGFAFVLRDRVTDIKNTARDKHVVAAMSGIMTGPETYQVQRLEGARLGQTGWVRSLHTLPLTDENATMVLACLQLGFGQISAGNRLDMLGNYRKIQEAAPQGLKSLTFQP